MKYFRSQEGDDLDEEKQGSRGENLNESYTHRKTWVYWTKLQSLQSRIEGVVIGKGGA